MEQIRKIKVAFFVGTFPAISESWLIEQAVNLIDQGIEIDFFSFKQGNSDHTSEKIKKYKLLERVTYLEFPSNKTKRLFLAIPAVFRFIFFAPFRLVDALNYKKYGKSALVLKYLFWTAPLLNKIDKYDVIHCHFGTVANNYLVIKDILKIKQKFIVTFYGHDSSEYIKAKGIKAYDDLKKEASKILVMTEEMKERFIGLRFPQEKLVVHYTGIIPENYQFNQKTYSSSEIFKIIFVGRFVEKKGIEDLLRAMQLVIKDYHNLRLYIVGDGDPTYRENIYKLTNDLGIEKSVKFIGLLSHRKTLKLFSQMHLMVQLSKIASNGDTDDLPFVLLEGQASGLPVVTTNHVGIPEGVLYGKSGFTVPEGDFRIAAQKILLLIKNPEILTMFSFNARKFVADKFNLHNINKHLMLMYKELTL